MLFREMDGDVFHVLCAETEEYYLSMCGKRVGKLSLEAQTSTETEYIRCPECQRKTHTRLYVRHLPAPDEGKAQP